MRSLVDLEVFAARKQLAAAFEAAGERLLAGVDSDVVHQLVFRLERLPVSTTLLPVARMVRLLGSPHVLNAHMRGQVGDMVEELGTGAFARPLGPQAAMIASPRGAEAVVHEGLVGKVVVGEGGVQMPLEVHGVEVHELVRGVRPEMVRVLVVHGGVAVVMRRGVEGGGEEGGRGRGASLHRRAVMMSAVVREDAFVAAGGGRGETRRVSGSGSAAAEPRLRRGGGIAAVELVCGRCGGGGGGGWRHLEASGSGLHGVRWVGPVEHGGSGAPLAQAGGRLNRPQERAEGVEIFTAGDFQPKDRLLVATVAA